MAFPLLIVPALLLLFGKNPNENPPASIAVGEKRLPPAPVTRLPVTRLPPVPSVVSAPDLAKITSTQTLAAMTTVSGSAVEVSDPGPSSPSLGFPVPQGYVTGSGPTLTPVLNPTDFAAIQRAQQLAGLDDLSSLTIVDKKKMM